jgi:Tol biopolymer transport system component
VQGENEDGDIVIWIIPFSGDDPVLLEMDVSVDGKPFPLGVSPNLKKLAFAVRRDDEMQDLYVVPISLKDARTTGPAVKVFDGWSRRGSYNTTTSLSPDGNKLAVSHRGDVWIASSNGDKPIQITKTPEKKSWLRWSSDGKMVHYIGRSGQYLRPLYVVPASGGKVTKILDNCRDYAWSPDRKELAVALNDLISIIPLQGGGTRQIARFKDLDLEDVHTLSWSPDGRYIACLGNHIVKGYSGPIFVIPVEGGRPTTLVTEDDGFKWGPSWSPDSKWIAYTSEGSVKMRPEGTMWEADFEEIVKKASR